MRAFDESFALCLLCIQLKPETEPALTRSCLVILHNGDLRNALIIDGLLVVMVIFLPSFASRSATKFIMPPPHADALVIGQNDRAMHAPCVVFFRVHEMQY